MQNEAGGRQNFGPQNAQALLRAIRGPWNGTLRKLTGQSFDSGAEWQNWWNKNKARRWQ